MRRNSKLPVITLLTLLGTVLAGGVSRAGNIDEPIANVLSGTAITVLEDMKCKTVGVLPFRYQKGSHPTFNAGLINGNTAKRLTNGMVLRNGVQSESSKGVRTRIQIADNVAQVARGKAKDWYTSESDRKKLFDLSYPLVWDNKTTVKPDVFLTGLIKVEPNGEMFSLTLEYFTKDDLKIRKLEYGEVKRIPVDRHFLGEASESFVITPAMKNRTKGASFDTIAARSAKRRDGESIPMDVQMDPNNVCGLALKIYYDDVEQTITREKDREELNELRVATPQPGQKVKIVVTHTGGGESLIPFVLTVNGQSTFNQEEGLELNAFRKWLAYSPSHPDNARGTSTRLTFNGFTNEEKKEVAFNVLTDEQSKTQVSQMGNSAGVIQLNVFGSGQQEFRKITTYGPSSRSLKQQPIRGYEDLVQRLWKTSNSKRVYGVNHRGLIEAGGDAYDTTVSGVELGSVSPIASLSIRYYSFDADSLDLKVTTD
jgi:hypothetical protein